jgi:hypothetical protein
MEGPALHDPHFLLTRIMGFLRAAPTAVKGALARFFGGHSQRSRTRGVYAFTLSSSTSSVPLDRKAG